MLYKVIFRNLITLLFFLNISIGARSQTEVLEIFRSSKGVIDLSIHLNDDSYAILYRDDLLTGSGRPISFTTGNNKISILRDQLAHPKSGFLRVKTFKNLNSQDSDSDGISDLIEMNSLGLMNPINPAPSINSSYGKLYILNKETFEVLSHRDNFPGSKDILEVKFVIYDIHTNSPKLYFINSKRFEYHFTFSRDAVGRYSENSDFNNHTYFTNSRRKNVAGSIVYHPNYVSDNGEQGIYTIEFWPSDPVAFNFIEPTFEMIVSSMPFLNGRVAYHPSSETQRTLYSDEIEKFKNSHIKIIETNKLLGDIVYNGLNTGESFGRLRLISGAQSISSRDIVILKNLPNDLSHVAGIITEQNQTPLSHINLKAKQNGTPNAFLKNASSDPRIIPLIGQNVYLKIGPDQLEIRKASQTELDDFFEKIRPKNTSFPKRNLEYKEIRDLSNVSYPMSNGYGSKSANLAELKSIIPSVSPEGFAIPFYYYHEFMTHNGFYSEVEQMINSESFKSFPSVRDRRLKEFRKRIKDTGILPGWMLDELRSMQESFAEGTPLRARSSTNNEDLEGFNGAGLYESYTHYPNEGHFAKTAKQVWAGLWTYRAFEERDFWRIDHLTASMGILVHPSFQEESANGVGVTKNIYIPGPGWDGHYVNVQKGENLVTNPEPGSVAEEYIIANLGFGSNYEIQYIRSSNQIDSDQRILTRREALKLKGYMDIIHSHFKNIYRGNSNFAMEIEFKLLENGKFIIKQARPWVE
ncbi:MAG: PEP/pyruvate-binding domain-containing protein [Verrucomicrobiales bacterium]